MDDCPDILDFSEDPELHWVDYLIFALFLVVSVAVGFIVAIVNKKKAATDNAQAQFLLGGSQMHPFPVALSLIASFLSSITVVSNPVESYNFGVSYGYMGITYLIVFPMVAYLYLPTFYKLKVTTVYEVGFFSFSPFL